MYVLSYCMREEKLTESTVILPKKKQSDVLIPIDATELGEKRSFMRSAAYIALSTLHYLYRVILPTRTGRAWSGPDRRTGMRRVCSPSAVLSILNCPYLRDVRTQPRQIIFVGVVTCSR